MTDFEPRKITGTDRRDLDVDLFLPAGKSNGVAVILVHGGGWVVGHRSTTHRYAQILADQGFVAICAEYRLLGEAPWPAQLEDVRDAVRWTKAHAETLGIDPAKVVLQGFSAGAHLALLVGGTQPGSGFEHRLGGSADNTQLGAIVSFFAAARLDNDPAAFDHPPLSMMLNGGGLEAAKAASPVYYGHKGFPSTFILGGMEDYMQPLDAGLDLLRALVAGGSEVEFHYFHSQVHEFQSTPGMIGPVMDEVVFYLRRTLVDREALAADAYENNMFTHASSYAEFAELMAARR